jgi:hypothetical protein
VFSHYTQNIEDVAVGGQLSISDNNIFTFASSDQNKQPELMTAAAEADTEELLEDFTDNNFQDCYPDPCWEEDTVNEDVSMNGLSEVRPQNISPPPPPPPFPAYFFFTFFFFL